MIPVSASPVLYDIKPAALEVVRKEVMEAHSGGRRDMRAVIYDGIKAVREGRDPLHVIRDPRKNDQSAMVVVSEVVPETTDYRDAWKKHTARPQAAE